MLTCGIDSPIAVKSNFDCLFACLKPCVPFFLIEVFGRGGWNIEETLYFTLGPAPLCWAPKEGTSVREIGEEVSLGSPRPIDLI